MCDVIYLPLAGEIFKLDLYKVSSEAQSQFLLNVLIPRTRIRKNHTTFANLKLVLKLFLCSCFKEPTASELRNQKVLLDSEIF